MTHADAPRSFRHRDALGWGLLALLLLYAVAVHHGLGPPPGGSAERWFEPTGFLTSWGPVLVLSGSPALAALALGIPAALLALGVGLATDSAVARALAASCVVAVLLFTFYGVAAPFVWEFFHWRGSAVIGLTSLFVGFSLMAPLLARSWLRFGWPLRLALYLPVAFASLAFVRNATGTNPELRFAISPWPAVPVFGIEVGALFVFVCLAGLAIGLVARARAFGLSGRYGALARTAGIALAVAASPALLALASALDLVPFRVGASAMAAAAAAPALGLLAAGVLGPDGLPGLRRQARDTALGAGLIALPLLAGQAWTRWDYFVTREQHARRIIEALERYADRKEQYPDALAELVASRDLERVPEPAIGFDFLDGSDFRYQNFGTSFILEFPAPRWVECAYTPPYDDDETGSPDEDDGDSAESAAAAAEGEDDDESLTEAWSCPSEPPELW